MQLCDAFDIPILSLIDTPGNMVGPEAEKTALIRHVGRMYVAGANIAVPLYAVVLRKAYGLGALAMSTGSFDETIFSVSWPTGEFAGIAGQHVEYRFAVELDLKAVVCALDGDRAVTGVIECVGKAETRTLGTFGGGKGTERSAEDVNGAIAQHQFGGFFLFSGTGVQSQARQ